LKPQQNPKTPEQITARPDDGKSRQVAMNIVNAVLEKKGLEPVLLDVRDLASYADYIVIASGRSDRQVTAIGDGVLDALREELGRRPLGTEGIRNGQWTLLDFGDVIVHVFYHPVREFYDLESLWIDAPRVQLDIPPESRITADAMYEQ
jgi:ribosome-associated protein